VPRFRIGESAQLLGVSDDTLRRRIDDGRLTAQADAQGRLTVNGADLARLATEMAEDSTRPTDRPIVKESARNRFTGLVTRVVRDAVMAQVEIQSGPHRIVSLMSRESADELGLEPGMRAVAAVKATNVVVEVSA
jgi:molybdopterin-binding protein